MNNSFYPSAYTKKVLDQYYSPITDKCVNNVMKKEVYASIIFSLGTELFNKFDAILPENKNKILVHEMDYSCYHRILSMEERNYIVATVWKIFVNFLSDNYPECICVLTDGNDESCNATFEIYKF